MWSIIGTAVQGRGHEAKNIPVQDKIFYHKGQVNVIALADGAGRAKLSHYGAEKAVETICNLLRDRFDEIFHIDSVEVAQKLIMKELHLQLSQLSEKFQEPMDQFASTLLAVAVKNNQALILHLGDGEIGAIKNDQTIMISSSENGEYANSTYFTTSPNAINHLKLFRSSNAQSFSSFFLMSDGAAFSLYSKKSKKFAPILRQLSLKSKIYKEEILNHLLRESFETLIKQKTNDDCSFIMMTATEEMPKYLNLSKADKELLLHYLKKPKHCSIKKWDLLVDLLKTPLTLRQIVKATHIKKTYIKDNLKALRTLGIVKYQNNKFFLAETGECQNED